MSQGSTLSVVGSVLKHKAVDPVKSESHAKRARVSERPVVQPILSETRCCALTQQTVLSFLCMRSQFYLACARKYCWWQIIIRIDPNITRMQLGVGYSAVIAHARHKLPGFRPYPLGLTLDPSSASHNFTRRVTAVAAKRVCVGCKLFRRAGMWWRDFHHHQGDRPSICDGCIEAKKQREGGKR